MWHTIYVIAPLKKYFYFFIVFTLILFIDVRVKAASGTIISGGVTNNNVKFANIQRRLVKTSSAWYYFYSEFGEIRYKKSTDGVTWDAAVNIDYADTTNYNPSVSFTDPLIYVSWVDIGTNVLEILTIDTSDSDTLGPICNSPTPDAGSVTTGYMTSIATAQDGTVYAAYSDASDYSLFNAGANPTGLFKIDYGACSFTDINGSVLFDDGARPQLVTINNTLHLVTAEYGALYHAIYNGTTWTTQWSTIADVDDNSMSLTTDGTNLYLASYIDPNGLSYFNDPLQGNAPISQSNHMFKWNGSAWSPMAAPYKDIDSAPTLIQARDDSNNVTQVGSDGFARILNYNSDVDSLEFIMCTNASCSTSNKSLIGTLITYVNNAGAMVLGNDGFGRIVYSTTDDNNIHLATCLDDACSTYDDQVVDSSGVTGASFAIEIASDNFPRIAYVNNAAQVKYIQCTNANCSTNNIDVVEDYNSLGLIPYYLSMDLGSDDLARIVFYERNSTSLRFLRCTNANCSAFSGFNVDDSGDVADMYASVRVLPDGNAIIGHGMTMAPNQAQLTLLLCQNANCTSFGVRSVDTFNIQAYPSSGISIALTTSGLPRVSFTDYSSGDVAYMECMDMECAIYKIIFLGDSNAAPIGNTYLALNSRGEPYLSYFSNTGSGLKYIGCGDGNCATNVTGISTTYDSVSSRLYVGILKNDNSDGFYKYTSVNSISWSTEDSLDYTPGSQSYISSNSVASSATDIGFASFVGSDVVFTNVSGGTPNNNPNAPSSLGPSQYIEGSISMDNTPTFTFSLSDPDVSNTVKFDIQVDTVMDFSSSLITYTSDLASQGTMSFTVGQAAGAGAYTSGAEGQTLDVGSYYWRVRAIDDLGGTSDYTTASVGVPAFLINEPPVISSLLGSYLFTDTGNITATATDSTQVGGVYWRYYSAGQGAEDGWLACDASDTSFNSATEAFDCAVNKVSNDREVIEFRAIDDLGVSSSVYAADVTFDTTTSVMASYDFSNLTDLGARYSQMPALDSPQVGPSLTLSTGQYNTGSVVFDAATSVVIADPDGYLDFADGADSQFSIRVRFKPSSSSIGIGGTLISRENWVLSFSATGSLFSSVSFPDGLVYIGLDSLHTQITYDQWNEALLSWNKSTKTMSLRLNDEKAVTATYLYKTGMASSTADLHIGEGYRGEIDDIVIYNKADSAPPIITITPLDDSSRVTTKTPTFNVTFTDETAVSSAEYLFLGPLGGAGDGIMDHEAWVSIPSPEDGCWGGTSESVVITAPPLIDGSWQVLFRAQDPNGNKNVYFEVTADYTYFPVTSPYVTPFYNFYVETVDTTAPRIYANSILPNPTIDKRPAVRGYVKDYLVSGEDDTSSNISMIRFKIDDGDFVETLPVDGTYNSTYEDFYINIPSDLTPGMHTIQIRADDAAVDFDGNAAPNSTADNTPGESLGDYIIDFTVSDSPESTAAEVVVKNITFDSSDSLDTIFSDAVWGNGILRLRQEITFNSSVVYGSGLHDEFGYNYGETTVSIYPSVDGNFWITTNDGGIIYYNKSTEIGTKYDLLGLGYRVTTVFEFEDGGNRYLALVYNGGASTKMYDINNTPENTADDPVMADYTTKTGFSDYKTFIPSSVDTRGGTVALIGQANQVPTSNHNSVIRVDLEGDPMDLESQTSTVWGEAEGLGVTDSGYAGNGITAFYFDQDRHLFLASHYAAGLYVCDDADTPEDKSDDFCSKKIGDGGDIQQFTIIKDPNDWYWVGGDYGLVRVFITGNVSDETFLSERVWASSAMSNDQIASLAFVAGDYPVGDEVWMMTRQGRVRAIEYNFTYDDSSDDTRYTIKVPQFEYRAGGVSTFNVDGRNRIWLPIGGQGLVQINLTREYEDSNIIEIYPNPPVGLLEVDNVTLQDIVGSVTVGSLYTFDQLVTYEISNDAGITWYEAFPDTPIRFSSSDYKLKVRITLHKGSSPIIDSLKLTYTAQPSGTLDSGGGVGGGDNDDGDDAGDSCTDTRPVGTPNIYRVEPLGTSQLKLYFDTNSSRADEFQIGVGSRSGYYPRSITTSNFSSGSYLISGLTPDSDYFIHMRARNGCKSGNWSHEVKAHTNQNAVDILIDPVKVPIDPDGDDGIGLDDIDIGDADILMPTKASDTSFSGFVNANTLKILSILLLPTLLEVLRSLLSYYSKFRLNGVKLFVSGFIRRRRLPWGIVYDSINKRPMDPVIVKLISQATGKVSQAVTDIYGRYSFIVEPGQYTVGIQKTNYTFPSKIIKSQLDEIVYEDVLTSTVLKVREKETVNLNIPIDALTRNWNEEEKVRMGNYEAPSKLLALVAKIGFILGLGWSVFVLIVSPSILNYTIFSLFALYLVYIFSAKKYMACGYLLNADGTASSGYVVELIRTKFPNINKRSTVTDNWGRYSFLVERGDYKVRIYKLDGNTKTIIYESENITVKSKIGIIDKKIRLNI